MTLSTQKVYTTHKAYTVVIEKTGNGYAAYLPDLPGCVAAGDSLEETRSLIAEATEMHLELLAEYGHPIPEPTEAVLVPSD